MIEFRYESMYASGFVFPPGLAISWQFVALKGSSRFQDLYELVERLLF